MKITITIEDVADGFRFKTEFDPPTSSPEFEAVKFSQALVAWDTAMKAIAAKSTRNDA